MMLMEEKRDTNAIRYHEVNIKEKKTFDLKNKVTNHHDFPLGFPLAQYQSHGNAVCKATPVVLLKIISMKENYLSLNSYALRIIISEDDFKPTGSFFVTYG